DGVTLSVGDLREQGQGVVGGDEHEGTAGLDRRERPEDRGVPDGVRDRPGVELGLAVVVAAGAAARLLRQGQLGHEGSFSMGFDNAHYLTLILGKMPVSPNRSGQEVSMTYVIAQPCVDVKDRACVDECPVDCIYEGGRSLYIHPDECVDCGACEPVCPVEAIYYEDDLPAHLEPYWEDNARFFTQTLPGRDGPLGSPGGAAKLGPLGVDTE